MTWLTDEQGVKSSKPVEIYDFVLGSTTYRYTSYTADVVFGGNTYTAAATERSELAIEPGEDGAENVVKLDSTAAIVQALLTGIPEFVMTGQIRRLQNGVAYQFARGPITACRVVGEVAEIRIGQLTSDPLRMLIGAAVLSKQCQHVLYDAADGGQCGSLRADHDFATTVTAASSTTLTVASVNSHPDGWYNDGEITVAGKTRHIVKQVGTTIEILQPFNDDDLGTLPTSCTLYDGCTRDPDDCATRHNQMSNYGGAPYLEYKNPFISRLAWDE